MLDLSELQKERRRYLRHSPADCVICWVTVLALKYIELECVERMDRWSPARRPIRPNEASDFVCAETCDHPCLEYPDCLRPRRNKREIVITRLEGQISSYRMLAADVGRSDRREEVKRRKIQRYQGKIARAEQLIWWIKNPPIPTTRPPRR